MKKSHLLSLGLCIILSACQQPKKASNDCQWTLKELEARHYDIPLLINAKPLPQFYVESEQYNSCIAYSTDQSFEDAINHYTQEMERYGWQQLFMTNQAEAILVFEKPTKYCSISIRRHNAHIAVIIFVSLK